MCGNPVQLPLLLLAFLITLNRFERYLTDKRKSSHDLMFPMEKSQYFQVYKQGCAGFIQYK